MIPSFPFAGSLPLIIVSAKGIMQGVVHIISLMPLEVYVDMSQKTYKQS
jgi:hypothetical protein